ncbi:MAG: amino acid adenylation domain-containing protein, partial [Prevotella sp.]|nr:amino acid adenylation domain-containing protein [Prevotella sp.]
MKQLFRLSQSQLGIFAECMHHPEEPVYDQPFLYTLSKEVDLSVLKTAIQKAFEAHPNMKCGVIIDDEGVPKQFINNEPLEIPIKTIDDIDKVKDTLWKPFHFDGSPLTRICLYEDNTAKYIFLQSHHLVFDGSTFTMLFNDIENIYHGGEATEEQVTAFEYAEEEEALRHGERMEVDRQWYVDHFPDLEVETVLHPDLAGKEPSYVRVILPLKTPMNEVMDFCKQHGIKVSNYMCGAYALLMARYNADDQVLFSTIWHGRPSKVLTKTAGMFVKTVPYYYHLKGEDTVADLLRQGDEMVTGTRQHHLFSLGDAVEELNLHPHTMFCYQGYLTKDFVVGGYPAVFDRLFPHATYDPLSIQVFQTNEGFQLYVEYMDNLYSAELIRQMAESFDRVVAQMMDTDRQLRDIQVSSPEQLLLLDTFNQTDMAYDDRQTIVSLFRKQAEQTPDHLAAVYKDCKLTYRQVDDITDRLAMLISSKGLKSEDIVSVLIPRCEWMVLASLGVLKAGCAYQPLDPSYPQERLNFMMKDASAKLLIADETLRPLVNEYEGEVLLTQELMSVLSDLPLPTEEEKRLMAPRPESLFIMLYTSGSTGVPKGCQLEHRNLVAFCHWYKHFYGLTSDCRVAAYASYGFDACMMDMYPALTTGASVFIIPEELRLNLPELNDYFEANDITHSFMTTQVGYQFATNMDNHSLHYFSVGGEKLSSLEPPKGYKMYNAYGPTECTILTTNYWVREYEKDIPIGKPLDNLRLYIVDRYGHRLPIGACGELWVSGPQVCRGYLNRPEKTAEVFIDNPFDSDEQHARIYRTGDIVRYLPDGNIQFIGRKDGQVKIRGFRIELKEIEAVIRQFPGIKDVTVQAFDDEAAGGKFIAAYIVSDEQVNINQLNTFILEEKPPYMVPAVTMQIERIPLNQNQKVDKKALPKPKREESGEKMESAAPLNVLEQELKTMVAGIVGHEDFTLTTPLGYAGLTSITAIKLAIQVNKRFGVMLDSKSLAKTGTLQSIENEVITHLMQGEKKEETPIQEKQEIKPVPLSYAQIGVYVDCMKQPTSTLYNIPTLLLFKKDTDTEKLETSLKTLVKTHPALTAHFGNEGATIVQITNPDQEVMVVRSKMTEAELTDYKREFVRPFNLKQGPLYRFEIVTTEEHIALLLDIHHLVNDGGSLNLFLHQLCALMDGEEIEQEDMTYADYVVAEKAAEDGTDYQAARDFFHSQLSACEGVTELASDLTNPLQQGTVSEAVSGLDFPAVEAFCRQHNITPAHLTLSAVFYALARFTNQERLCITTISSGRSNLRISNTMGMFINTLALSSLVGDQKVIDFITQTSQDFDETLRHENYPFAQIAADYDLSAEIMFAYQMGVLEEYVCQGDVVPMENLELDVPKFRLAFYIREHEGQPSVCIEYDNGRYSEGLMCSLAQSVSNIVSAFIAAPEANLLGVSMLNQQQTQLLDSFNLTDVAYDDTQTIISLFRRQVELTPDNTCVVYHDHRYTYREVDDISECIAFTITSRKLGSEDVVSVLIPRCEWMVIASLGVLKAGCAYQPLDPSYPAERLNFMIDDAAAKLLIADEELRPIVDGYQGDVLLTKDIKDLPAATQPVKADIRPNNLFILLYTSGSTGVPKGCQLLHSNLVAFCHWYQRHYELHAGDRVAAYASYGFDACMMDIYPAVTCGATVYIVGEDIRLNLPDLNNYFNDNGITHSFMTTQVGFQFATNVDNHSLRCFAVGGEKLSALNPPQHYKMYNGYGPTECTVFTTNYWVREYEQDIPIGKPLDNLRLFVVDKHFNRLPVGACGELWVSGPQVSRGYLNRPEKTAEVFISNPFDADANHSRIYRTGDIVRYLPDGNIQFVGRRDGQVKIRGFRIELKEVEAVIRKFPGIKDATVQAFDYENGGKYIAAYIVSDEQVEIKDLNDFIGKQKPSYMIPAATMQIDRIPLNQNQKVNRKALPAPVLNAQSSLSYVAPANDLEQIFCDIFGTILSMDKVGATDNFFELGGTSLMVTRVIIEVDKKGYHIAYGDFFNHPTPRQMAQFVSGETVETADTNDEHNADAAYDYKPIDIVLMRNTLDNFRKGERQAIGNVLLTGSTGYLGIHILKELIDRDDVPTIWCMVRAENEEKAERRLKQLLFYYYGRNYKELFGTRLRIALGDVTHDIHVSEHVDTVFNCAAVVKHFSKGTEIEDVNIGGAVNCVKFCLATGARLIHVSTYSTAGLSIDGIPGPDTVQTEQNLFFGQFMDNQYIHSKFISERVVLEAVAIHGLNGKVMRVGNLAPRSTDGEFQINFQTNSAMGRIRVFKMLGCYPYEMSDDPMEFSPINEVAQSIVLLSETPRECCLFHPYNNHSVHFGDVLSSLEKIGDSPKQV